MAARMDWPALMAAGIGGLGLTPGAFWALSPAELRLMLGGGAAAPALGRADLEALQARFPDTEGAE